MPRPLVRAALSRGRNEAGVGRRSALRKRLPVRRHLPGARHRRGARHALCRQRGDATPPGRSRAVSGAAPTPCSSSIGPAGIRPVTWSCRRPHPRLPASGAPELDPVENIWPHLHQNWLSNRVFETYEAIIEAACDACVASSPSPPPSPQSATAAGRTSVRNKGRWYQMRRISPRFSTLVQARILDIYWTRCRIERLSTWKHWRSLGDSNPCFRRERAKRAYASLPRRCPISSIVPCRCEGCTGQFQDPTAVEPKRMRRSIRRHPHSHRKRRADAGRGQHDRRPD